MEVVTTRIFEAWHYKIGASGKPDKSDERQSARLLGEYTSDAKAEVAISRHRDEDGFRDWPYGFRIEETPLDVGMAASSTERLTRTYDVRHFDIGRDDAGDTDDPTQSPTKLGAFSSKANATVAIERARPDPRFRNFPDGFVIFSARPDIDHWEGGFISWDDA